MCTGAGDGLVHRLPGPHLLLVPRLPGGEQVQQGVCDLRRRPLVGHGESGITAVWFSAGSVLLRSSGAKIQMLKSSKRSASSHTLGMKPRPPGGVASGSGFGGLAIAHYSWEPDWPYGRAASLFSVATQSTAAETPYGPKSIFLKNKKAVQQPKRTTAT